MRKTIGLTLSLSMLSACAHRSPSPQPSVFHVNSGSLISSARLVFPYGRYRHQVNLRVLRDRGTAINMAFEGYVTTSPETVLVVALSPLQTTLMSVREDRRTGEVRLETFDDRLRKVQERLGDYYSILRRLVLLEKPASKPGAEWHTSLESSSGRAEIVLRDYVREIPRQVEVLDPHFHLDIHVEPLDEVTP